MERKQRKNLKRKQQQNRKKLNLMIAIKIIKLMKNQQ
jgi:hypothetical protein